jgi:hypothetical protein
VFGFQFDEIKCLNVDPKPDKECKKHGAVDLLSEIIAYFRYWQTKAGNPSNK